MDAQRENNTKDQDHILALQQQVSIMGIIIMVILVIMGTEATKAGQKAGTVRSVTYCLRLFKL